MSKRVESKVRFEPEFYKRLQHTMADRERKSMQGVIEEALETWISCAPLAQSAKEKGHLSGKNPAGAPVLTAEDKGDQLSTRDSTPQIPAKSMGVGHPSNAKTAYSRDQPDRNIEDLLLAARRLLTHPIIGPALSIGIAAFDHLASQPQGKPTSSAATPSDLSTLTPEEERRRFEEYKSIAEADERRVRELIEQDEAEHRRRNPIVPSKRRKT